MAATKRYDSIIIGGGHNGLVCAAYLAKAGRKVLVLERRHVLGGAAVTEEIFPGFKYSVCSYVVSLLRPQIIRDLELPKHGLQILPLECSFAPAYEGPGLVRWPDAERTRNEIARYSERDASLYPEFGKEMGLLARYIKPIIDNPAPKPTSLRPTELAHMARLGGPFRSLERRRLHRMLKMMTMSAADFLDEWFESDVLKAPMSVSGIIGTYLGVRSPGTAYVLLHHYMGEIDGAMRAWGLSRGGTGEISMSIARAAERYGAEIRTTAGVSKIITKGGRATGVALEDGTELQAKTIVSGVDPKLTFMKLVGEELLPSELVDDLKRYRLRGSSGKVNLALDGLPEFRSRPGDGLHMRGDIAIAPSIDYLERAYDDAKYGAFSRRPYINVVLPSLTDNTVAPPGKHVMSCFVQYAPYHLAEGPEAWPEKSEAFGDTVIDTLEELAPGLKDRILHRQVVTPWDMEQEFGMSEGNIFHGELSIEQLAFLRPAPGWAHYRTPIHKLWMCGSGTHPGGGLMGAPGKLAAEQMLKERAL